MKMIERENIDVKKWDELVAASSDDFFSFSWYLDALADNWCVLANEDYSKGIAIPYTLKAGVKLAYIPVFSRYVEWLGEGELDLQQLFSQGFKGYDLRIKGHPEKGSSTAVYQKINVEEDRVIGSQAKRMLKKAEKSNFEVVISTNVDFAFELIQSELKGKFKGVNDLAVERLEALCYSAVKSGFLKVFSIEDTGAIICLESKQKMLYLKGTATEEGKKHGAMYYLMDHAIQYAQGQELIFDFGGSNVEGVKRFNQNLGGKDVAYSVYRDDRSPFWYKMLRKLKHRGNY